MAEAKAPNNVVFAVGTGRCGSKTLAHLFAQLPEVEAVHEPMPSLARIAAMRLAGEPYNVAHTLLHARADVDNHLHYLESALWNTWLIPDLLAKWPQAKFIHLQRDPHKFAHSAYRRGWYHPKSESNAGAFRLLRPVPAEGWPPQVNRWFKLGYLWGRYTTHIKSTCYHNSTWQADINDLNDLTKLNELVEWCEFPGTITELRKENVGNERITLEEIQLRGLEDDLDKTGFQYTYYSHPYAWMTVRRLKEKGMDIEYKDMYPLTREVKAAVDAGVEHAVVEHSAKLTGDET